MIPWLCPQALVSAPMKSSLHWAPEAWERCIARHTRLERDVAIKVLPAHLSSDPDLKQRMEREAKAISSLNHPHICTLHDVGSQDGVDFSSWSFWRAKRSPTDCREVRFH